MYDTDHSERFVACEFPLPLDGGRTGVRLSSLISLDSIEEQNGAESSWVHFAPFGVWEGHEQGKLTFDKKNFEEIIANFKALSNDLQVDYEHDSINKQLKGPKPAAGWIKALEIRGNGSDKADGLWAFVEWTKRAAQFIRNREYKYTSPVIDPTAKDRKTNKKIGVELFNAALTNDPFLDGQVPLALERLPLQMEIKIKDKEQQSQGTVAASEQSVDQNAQSLQDEGGGSVVDKIAETLGMEPAAVESIMLAKMEEIAAIVASESSEDGTPADEATASDQPPQTAAADKWNKALESRIATLEKDKANERKAYVLSHVNKKIDDGYILDDDKELALELYTEDFDRAEKIYKSQLVPLGRKQANEKNQNKSQSSVRLDEIEEDSVRQLCRAWGCSKEVATEKVIALRKAN